MLLDRRFRSILAGLLSSLSLTSLSAQQQAAVPTFSNDVAPIFYEKCVACHRPGEIAPMSLITYDQTRPWARSIRQKVLDGSMPPWHAEAPLGTFLNERALTEGERTTIVRWADNGAPQGDPRDLPPAPRFQEGWSIGTPDAVATMPREFDVPPSGEIAYQYFQAPSGFTEDKWIQAIEIRPGTPEVVHHVLVYSRPPEAGNRSPAFRAANPPITAPAARGNGPVATALRERLVEAVRGRATQRRPGNNLGDLIATTAPGTNALIFAPGRAMKIPAGSTLTFQMHYTVNGKPLKDKSSIGFVFAKEPPKEEVRSDAFVNALFLIPAGAANHRVDSAIEFLEDAEILALFPHTHLRGKSWQYRMVYPDGRSEVVLSTPNYNFNWQTYYQFARPLSAPKGSRLEGTAHYDNSAANRANPDPTLDVRWGDQTWEEMQYTGITYVVKRSDQP